MTVTVQVKACNACYEVIAVCVISYQAAKACTRIHTSIENHTGTRQTVTSTEQKKQKDNMAKKRKDGVS